MGLQRGARCARAGRLRRSDDLRRRAETDFTIADFVADLRAPTPSAAAELLTRDWSEWREEVAGLRARLDRTTRLVLAENRRHLARLASSYALREPLRVVRQWAQRLDDLRETLRDAAKLALQRRRHELSLLRTQLAAHHPARAVVRRREQLVHLEARLRTLGPQGTLDRGYALVLDAQGRRCGKREGQGRRCREHHPRRRCPGRRSDRNRDQTRCWGTRSRRSRRRDQKSRAKRSLSGGGPVVLPVWSRFRNRVSFPL